MVFSSYRCVFRVFFLDVGKGVFYVEKEEWMGWRSRLATPPTHLKEMAYFIQIIGYMSLLEARICLQLGTPIVQLGLLC